MDVSVIIINYNTFRLTCNCIQSIIEKTQDVSYEIILVDNGSVETDPKEFSIHFPDIKLIRSVKNLGFAKGNNLGIAGASGKYVLLLNSDTTLKNDAISISREFLESHASVAVVTARLEFADGTVQHNCQRFPSIRYKLFELFRLQKFISKPSAGRILLGSFFNHDKLIFPDWTWGTFFMFRRELLDLLPEKKLTDSFFMYGEDMQWCMEFRKLGYAVAFEPSARIIHYMGQSKGRKSMLMKENHQRFMELYYSVMHRRLISLLDHLLSFKLTRSS